MMKSEITRKQHIENMNQLNNKIGFVFGNGQSRLRYKLNEFIGKYLTAGCNALYRDYAPDILVAVDPPMSEEIINSRYHNELVCVCPQAKYLVSLTRESGKDAWLSEQICYRWGWSAGSTALRLLCERHKELEVVNLIGFDLYGIEGRVNNVYANTRNYLDKNRDETHWGAWVKQLAKVFEKFPDIDFCRIGNINDVFPQEWYNFKNVGFVEVPILE